MQNVKEIGGIVVLLFSDLKQKKKKKYMDSDLIYKLNNYIYIMNSSIKNKNKREKETKIYIDVK